MSTFESPISYLAERQQLVAQEVEQSWDQPARQSASEAEKRAAAVIARIREHERRNLFGNLPGEAVPGPETADMGGRFLPNIERIEQSRVYAIAKDMPKGCHLHIHFNAELPPELLLLKAREVPETMFVRCTQPLLCAADLIQAEIVFEVKPRTTPIVDIFSKDYDPTFKPADSRPWMNWVEFRHDLARRYRDQFSLATESSPSQGQLTHVEQWARDKAILTLNDIYAADQTTNG